MTHPQSVIHIECDMALGFGYSLTYQDVATAVHYLEQKAARHQLELTAVKHDHVYQIGLVTYLLRHCHVWTIADVDDLQKEHETCSGLPSRLNTTSSARVPSLKPATTRICT